MGKPQRHTGVFQTHASGAVVVGCSCGENLGTEESMKAANEAFGAHYRQERRRAPKPGEQEARR